MSIYNLTSHSATADVYVEPIARPIVLLVLARRTVALKKKFFFSKCVALVPFLRCIKEWSFYWYYETKCLIVDF